MRPIDADDLKLVIRDDEYIDGDSFARVKEHIDEAPTVTIDQMQEEANG